MSQAPANSNKEQNRRLGRRVIHAPWSSSSSNVFASVQLPKQLRHQREHNLLERCQFGTGVPKQLPAGWQKTMSKSTGDSYYYSTVTGESRWTPPPTESQLEDYNVPIARPLTAPAWQNADDLRRRTSSADEPAIRNLQRSSARKPQLPRNGDHYALKGEMVGSKHKTRGPFNPWRAEPPPQVKASEVDFLHHAKPHARPR
mmetsp:Transcript_13150/g.20642  ORF Transcript_13150/g.20642 Transcript_13150/m.20642 type:complete len:201 (+) Transcript_13150:2-604(+)